MDFQLDSMSGQMNYHSIDDISSDESIEQKSDSEDSEWTPKSNPNSKRKSKSTDSDVNENDNSNHTVCDSNDSELAQNAKQNVNSKYNKKKNDSKLAQKRDCDRYRRLRVRSSTEQLRELVPNITDKSDFATVLESTVEYLMHLSKCHKNSCDDFKFMSNLKIFPKISVKTRKRVKTRTQENLDLEREESMAIEAKQEIVETAIPDSDSQTLEVENTVIEEQIYNVLDDLNAIISENDLNCDLTNANTQQILQKFCGEDVVAQNIVQNEPQLKPKRKSKFQVKYKN